MSELYTFCKQGNIDLVKIITNRCNNLNELNKGLEGACEGGNVVIVCHLIDHANINNMSLDWDLGFKSACKGGHLIIAELMIAHGITDWSSALQYTLKYLLDIAPYDLIKMIITKTIESDKNKIIDRPPKFALYYVCRIPIKDIKRRLAMVNFTISKGSMKWNHGFCGACEGGNVDIINLILSKWDKYINDVKENRIKFDTYRYPDIKNLVIKSYENRWNKGLLYAKYGKQMGIVDLMIYCGANDMNDTKDIYNKYKNAQVIKYTKLHESLVDFVLSH